MRTSKLCHWGVDVCEPAPGTETGAPLSGIHGEMQKLCFDVVGGTGTAQTLVEVTIGAPSNSRSVSWLNKTHSP